MMTIAVAVRQPQSQEQYRSVLGEIEAATQFLTNHESLIKCIRTRPIDLIIFDLNDRRWPARKWLDAAERDNDLAAVPVVWIGSEALPTDLRAVEEYRPGVYLPKLPDPVTLMQVLETLVGGSHPDVETNVSASEVPHAANWKPAVKTIDQALSIFADQAHGSEVADSVSPSAVGDEEERPTTPSEPGKDSDNNYDWVVAEMVKTDSPSNQSHANTAFIDSGTAPGTEKGTLIPTAAEEAQPISVNLADADAADDELVDRIVAEVAAQLASDIVRNLDYAAIRRAVEAALARPR